MIILTGYKGFIGRNFHERLKELDDVVITVDSDTIEWLVYEFSEWEKVDLVIHQGALSSTIEKDLNKIHHYNVDLTVKLLRSALDIKSLSSMHLLHLCMETLQTETSIL